MRLVDFLRDIFKDGIPYEDAVDVCMAIYCSGGIVPSELTESGSVSMDDIAQAFAEISRLGLVTGYSVYKSVPFGANYHDIKDKGHWVEVQASTLKLNKAYDRGNVDRIMGKLKR